jgi:hypothetical protein
MGMFDWFRKKKTRPPEAVPSTGTAKQVIPTLESLQKLLASLEVELRSSRNLPVGRLRVKREQGENVIAWSGDSPSVSAAEEFLAPRLANIGIRLSGSAAHTQDDDGSVMMFWSFRNALPARSLPTETAVLRLRMIPEALAAREALELAQEENFELLVAWLLEDRSFGIPYKVLRESGSAKAADRSAGQP